jgi:valyl-tRNA synthetase
METGHDIIFFWVARMMMMGIHFMGDVPFRTVFLHPMVRDEKGQKMSKTKGNVIDPLVITEQYGADALRFTLAALTSAAGRDIKLAKDRIEGYRAFANKLWNATRFAMMHLEGAPDPSRAASLARTPADRWLLARLARAVNGTVDALEAYRFDEAAGTVYRFIWNDLCDWYIELAKESLYGDDEEKKAGARAVLAHALDTALRLLHPMMPFVTEELWQTLKTRLGATSWPASILEAPYPLRRDVDEEAERSFAPVLGVVEAIRNVRGEMNVPWKTVFHGVEVGALSPAAFATVRAEQGRIERLGNVQGLVLHEAGRPAGRRPQCAVAVGDGFEVLVPLAGAVDMAAETARVDKELAKIAGELDGVAKRLANPSFVERAPREVVEEARARVAELGEKRRKLEAHRALLAEVPEAAPASAPVPARAEPAPATAVPEPRAAPAAAEAPPATGRSGAPLAVRGPSGLAAPARKGLVARPAGRMVKKGPSRLVRKGAAALVRRGPAPLALPAGEGAKAVVKPKAAGGARVAKKAKPKAGAAPKGRVAAKPSGTRAPGARKVPAKKAAPAKARAAAKARPTSKAKPGAGPRKSRPAPRRRK